MKEIKLTRGMVAMVDDSDYDWLNQWKWHALKRTNQFYAMRRLSKRGKFVHISRLVLGLNDAKLFPDHIDRNTLNNQRSNLRIATRSDNNSNRISIGISGYLGVFPAGANSWFARICEK